MVVNAKVSTGRLPSANPEDNIGYSEAHALSTTPRRSIVLVLRGILEGILRWRSRSVLGRPTSLLCPLYLLVGVHKGHDGNIQLDHRCLDHPGLDHYPRLLRETITCRSKLRRFGSRSQRRLLLKKRALTPPCPNPRARASRWSVSSCSRRHRGRGSRRHRLHQPIQRWHRILHPSTVE